MSDNRHIYIPLIPLLDKAARSCGYNMAYHGTFMRDMDCVGVPWDKEVKDASELIAEISNSINPVKVIGPTQKPHGRKAWSFILKEGVYVDLSVTPQINA